MPESLENPESRFYSLTMQRELGTTSSRSGTREAAARKASTRSIANPAVLTPEQAATVRAGGTIPSVQARRVYPELGVRTLIPAYVGPSGNDVEAKSEYNALFVTANRRLSRGPDGELVVHLQQVDEQQRRVARRGRYRPSPASARRACSTTKPSGAGRSSTVHTGWRSATSARSPGRVRPPRPDHRRVAVVGYYVGTVRPAVHDHHRRRLERGLDRRRLVRSAEHQHLGFVRVGRATTSRSRTTATTPCR